MGFEALRLKQEFKKVLNEGTKTVLRPFVLFYAPNELNYVRAGFIAARKSFPKAVLRNRARRRLRGLIREFTRINIPSGFDIVLIARNQCLRDRFNNMSKEISNSLNKLAK